MATNDIKSLSMLRDNTAGGPRVKCMTLSIMTINTGAKGLEVIKNIGKTFGSFSDVDWSKPSSYVDGAAKFIDNSAIMMQSFSDVATSQVDDPASPNTKVAWVYMPLPSKIEDSYTQSYEDNMYSLEERMVKAGAHKGAQLLGMGLRNNNIPTMFDDLLGEVETYMKRDNFIIDQNVLSTYMGSNPRSITFQFDIIPENKEHAKRIQDIVLILKNYSRAKRDQQALDLSKLSTSEDTGNPVAPSSDAQTSSPEVANQTIGSTTVTSNDTSKKFHANFLNQNHVVTFQFHVDSIQRKEQENIQLLNAVMSAKSNTSTLTPLFGSSGKEISSKETEDIATEESSVSSGYFIQDINITYGVDGAMSTYSDGVPKYMNIVMSLIERKPMYSNNFKKNLDTILK